MLHWETVLFNQKDKWPKRYTRPSQKGWIQGRFNMRAEMKTRRERERDREREL